MLYLKLSDLPESHRLRNSELGSIQAECRNLKSTSWRPVAKWKIASCYYNELSGPWIEFNEFRVPDNNLTNPK